MSKLRIEDFILQNKDAFDIIEPAPIAATGIHSSTTKIVSSSIKSITMKVLAIISITTVTVISYLTFSNRENNTVTTANAEEKTIQSPTVNTTQETPTTNQSSAIYPGHENPITHHEKHSPTAILDEQIEADPEIINTVYTQQNWDSIQLRQPETYTWVKKGKSVTLNIDTLFTGITHVEINTNSFDVFVKGQPGSHNVNVNVVAENKIKGIVINDPEIEVICTLEGSVLKIKALFGGSVGLGNFETDGTLTLNVPENATIKLNHDYGNLDVSNLITNMFNLQAVSGNIKITNVTAPINVHVDYGNVQLDKTVGVLNMDIGSCNVMCGNQQGDINIKSEYCNLSMGGVQGNINGKLNSGKVDILDVAGNIKFDADYSNIKMNNVKGDLNMTANSGNIIGDKIELISTANVNTEYGSVDIDFINDISKMSFDLKTHYGNILLQDGNKTHNTQGDLLIERGGILVTANIDSGNINIK
jgi:hypothetical protein